jgi:hypothetical protein
MEPFTPRQLAALAAPLTSGSPAELRPHTRHRDHLRGLLTTILAVDR